MHIEGQCHCGHVRYQAEIDPEDVSICHCSDCQQLTGSAYRVTAVARTSDLRLTAHPPKRYTKQGDNGRPRHQFFCPECGSPLFTSGEGEDAEVTGIRLGTIDQRRELAPRSQIWCRSALAWVDTIGTLPGRAGD